MTDELENNIENKKLSNYKTPGSLNGARGLLTTKALHEVDDEMSELDDGAIKYFRLPGSSARKLKHMIKQGHEFLTSKKELIRGILEKAKLKYQLQHPELYPLNNRIPDIIWHRTDKPTNDVLLTTNFTQRQQIQINSCVFNGIDKFDAMHYLYHRKRATLKIKKRHQDAKKHIGEVIISGVQPDEVDTSNLSLKFQKRARLTNKPLTNETISAFKLSGAAGKRLRKMLQNGMDYYKAKKILVVEALKHTKAVLKISSGEEKLESNKIPQIPMEVEISPNDENQAQISIDFSKNSPKKDASFNLSEEAQRFLKYEYLERTKVEHQMLLRGEITLTGTVLRRFIAHTSKKHIKAVHKLGLPKMSKREFAQQILKKIISEEGLPDPIFRAVDIPPEDQY